VPSLSLMSTFSSSMIKFADTTEPDTFRQFAQWQRWPRGFVKSSLSLIVTVMLPHRQLPVRESLNEERSCRFGSPVRCDIFYELSLENYEIRDTD
jgi:hypothetical protein